MLNKVNETKFEFYYHLIENRWRSAMSDDSNTEWRIVAAFIHGLCMARPMEETYLLRKIAYQHAMDANNP